MNKRILVMLTVVGVLCALAFWFVSQNRSASVNTVTPATVQTVEPIKASADSLTESRSESEVHRAAVDASVAPELETSHATELSADMALVKVLVIETTTHAPVPDARVYSMCDSPRFAAKGLEDKQSARGVPFEILVTDADGRAEIETPANVKSDLVARGDGDSMGFATREIPPLAEGTTYEVTIEIGTQADMPFWVKVVDETTQAPLAGVKIAPRVEGKADRPIETDALGLAKVQAKSWAQEAFDLEAKGHARLFVVSESGHERADTALVITLPLAATLRVHAVLASGAPAAGADVNLSAQSYELLVKQLSNSWSSGANPLYRMNLDGAGRGTLADLPPRVKLSVDVRGPCKWKAAETIVLEPGEVRDVEWSITEGCEIHGRLVDQNGGPVTMQAIWLRKPDVLASALFQQYDRDQALTCVTDGNGRFSIARVSAGSWWIGPAARNPTKDARAEDVAPLAQLIAIPPEQTTFELTLRVDRGLYIRGHVLDSSGRPAKSVHVLASDTGTALFDQTNSRGEDGAFSVGPLMNGSYALTAGGSNGDAGSASVTARTGQYDVVLQLMKGASMSGRVLGDDGNGVAGIVRISNRDTTASGPYSLTVQNDGSFRIDGLTPGTFDVSAATSNGWIGYVDPVELAPGGGAKDLVVRVSQGGKVRVRGDGPENLAWVSILQRGISVAGEDVAPGKAQEWPCPIGNVVVRIRFFGADESTIVRTLERSVDVKAGETVDVVFEKDAH